MPKRYWISTGVALVAVLAIAWAVRRTQAVDAALTDTQALSGERRVVRLFREPAAAPSFAVTDLDGRTVSPARGKVVLLNFWATWCGPCRAEIPELVALQNKYRNQLQIIGISMDDAPPEYVKRFAVELKINYPVVMATDQIKKAYPGIFGLPTTFILDQEARIAQKHIGLLNGVMVEDEMRVLAGLPVNASVEQIDDTRQAKLMNAAQATEIPGIDLAKVPAGKRAALLQELNAGQCTCGCGLTIAQCRINDENCAISLPLAKKIAEKYLN